MTIVRTITKNVITRAWHDLEPKLITFLATGLSASVIIEAANYVGWNVNPAAAAAASVVIATIFGYIKSSTTKTLAAPVPPAAVVPAIPADSTPPTVGV